jgi:hypothetical protein
MSMTNPNAFSSSVKLIADETLQSLELIWKEAGYEESECQGFLGDLLNKLKLTCTSELAAEQKILDHAKDQILKKLEYFNNLCNKLGRTGKCENELGINCSTKFTNLERLVSSIELEVSERESLLEIEYNKISELLKYLGEPVPSLDSFRPPVGSSLLSDARLDLLRNTFAQFQQIKIKRVEDMKKMCTECCEYMKDLEITSEGWDLAILQDSEYNYSSCNTALSHFKRNGEFIMNYSNNDLDILIRRLNSLKAEKDRRREELTKTGAEIARLWVS